MTRRGERFTCVTQYDHGSLAGELGAGWGNERFAPVAPRLRDALVTAAAHHDDGWHELDDLPAINPEAGRPAHFLELPLERTAPPYGRGVDAVYARDPLAGALVGMHWTGLYSGRWGLQSSGGPLRHRLARQVVVEQERRSFEARREAWAFEGPRSEFEAAAWHAYEVLQALDVISLALSLTDPSLPSDRGAEPVLLTGILAAIEQPPGARIVPTVPSAPLGEHLDLTLAVTAPGEATIDPWPFAAARFELELPARTVPRRASEEDAVAAYRAAPPEPIRWSLASSSTRG
ncbi:MAG: DUF3891 family protein [Solirubrobacterales bacterium]